MSPFRWILVAALIVGAIVVGWLMLPSRTPVVIPPGVSSANPGMAGRGVYLMRTAGCLNCHWDRERGGAPFAGGRALVTSYGVFFTPNITPDMATGIGAWSDEDFVRALKHGEGRAGEQLYPTFPFTSYTRMTVEDMLAIKAFLAQVPAVSTPRYQHSLAFPFGWRPSLKIWRLFAFRAPPPLPYNPSRGVIWHRGQYLVEVLGHCGECHTPRGFLGALDETRRLQGNFSGPGGWSVPALVGPRSELANWSMEEIEEYINSGSKPDFDSAQGPMAEVIEGSTKHLTDEDQQAISHYLKSLNKR